MPKLSPDLSARVRRGHIGDVVAVAQLWRDAWCSANPRVLGVDPLVQWIERARRDFGEPNELWVVDAPGSGPAQRSLDAFWVSAPQQRYLYQLHVAPHRQGRGLGSQLLARICADLSRVPVAGDSSALADTPVYADAATVAPTALCSLHTATGNTQALRFYERHGWVRGVVDHDPKSGRARVLLTWGAVAA